MMYKEIVWVHQVLEMLQLPQLVWSPNLCCQASFCHHKTSHETYDLPSDKCLRRLL